MSREKVPTVDAVGTFVVVEAAPAPRMIVTCTVRVYGWIRTAGIPLAVAAAHRSCSLWRSGVPLASHGDSSPTERGGEDRGTGGDEVAVKCRGWRVDAGWVYQSRRRSTPRRSSSILTGEEDEACHGRRDVIRIYFGVSPRANLTMPRRSVCLHAPRQSIAPAIRHVFSRRARWFRAYAYTGMLTDLPMQRPSSGTKGNVSRTDTQATTITEP